MFECQSITYLFTFKSTWAKHFNQSWFHSHLLLTSFTRKRDILGHVVWSSLVSTVAPWDKLLLYVTNHNICVKSTSLKKKKILNVFLLKRNREPCKNLTLQIFTIIAFLLKRFLLSYRKQKLSWWEAKWTKQKHFLVKLSWAGNSCQQHIWIKFNPGEYQDKHSAEC